MLTREKAEKRRKRKKKTRKSAEEDIINTRNKETHILPQRRKLHSDRSNISS